MDRILTFMRKRNKNMFFLGLFFISLYLFVFKLPFPGTDDLILKQPAINFIRGLGFSAPGVTGFLPGVEKAFVQYPPVYFFIFGIWFLLFGFSISSSLSLSFLICAAIAFIQVLLFERVLKEKLAGYIYGLIFFSWTIALGAIHRADALSTLLGLSLLLLIIRKASGKISFITQLIIILLMGLTVGVGFGLGVLILLQLLFVLISIRGFNIQTIKIFSIWCSFAILLCALLWWIPLHSQPHLFRAQFIQSFLYQINPQGYTYMFLEGLRTRTMRFSYLYFTILFYIPAIVCLTLLFVAGVFLENDKTRRNFLLWQFLGIITIWILIWITAPYKYAYQQVFIAFFIFICGVSSIRVFESLKSPCLKNILILVIFFCLGVSCLPFFRMMAFPLTWEKQDTYAYNKELILKNVPKGSKILTNVRFWYIFDKDYEIYDLYFGSFNMYICDYVLLVSGGSGKPEVAPLYFFSGERDVPYFRKHFTKQLSTMSNQPNRLFGLPISRSRWCYRFELYKRRTANNANFPNSL